MEVEHYRRFTHSTFVLKDATHHDRIVYCLLGLTGETGEVVELIKKCIRRGDSVSSLVGDAKILDELGDVLYYFIRLSAELGFTFDDISNRNVRKLSERVTKNEIVDR